MFFSIAAANSDGFDHLRGSIVDGALRLEWNDQPNGGHQSYGDAVFSMQLTAPPEGDLFSYQPATTDVNGDPITSSLIQAPDLATIDSQTGIVRWHAQPGTGNFTVRASDGHGGIADQSFQLHVTAGNTLSVDSKARRLSGDELGPDFSTSPQLRRLADEALARLTLAGLPAVQVSQLRDIPIRTADLYVTTIAAAAGDTIILDTDAAGYGWFVDRSPEDNVEFSKPGAVEGIDLLTALTHEYGHLLGLTHDDLTRNSKFRFMLAVVTRDGNEIGRVGADPPVAGLVA